MKKGGRLKKGILGATMLFGLIHPITAQTQLKDKISNNFLTSPSNEIYINPQKSIHKETYTLDSLERYALENNTGLKTLRKDLDILGYYKKNAFVDAFLPKISGNTNINQEQELYAQGNFYLNFKYGQSTKIKRAKNEIRKKEIDIANAESSVTREVIIKHANIIKTLDDIQITREWISELESILQPKDSINKAILEKARNYLGPTYSELKGKEEELTYQYRIQVSELFRYINKDYNEDEGILFIDRSAIETPNIPNEREYLHNLVKAGMDIQIEKELINLENTSLSVRESRSNSIPTGFFGVNYLNDFKINYNHFSVVVGVRFTLLDWGNNRRLQKVAKIRQEQIGFRLEQTEKNLEYGTKYNYLQHQRFSARIPKEKTINQMEQNYQDIKKEYLNCDKVDNNTIKTIVTELQQFQTAYFDKKLSKADYEEKVIEQNARLRQTFRDFNSPIEKLGYNKKIVELEKTKKERKKRAKEEEEKKKLREQFLK